MESDSDPTSVDVPSHGSSKYSVRPVEAIKICCFEIENLKVCSLDKYDFRNPIMMNIHTYIGASRIISCECIKHISMAQFHSLSLDQVPVCYNIAT